MLGELDNQSATPLTVSTKSLAHTRSFLQLSETSIHVNGGSEKTVISSSSLPVPSYSITPGSDTRSSTLKYPPASTNSASELSTAGNRRSFACIFSRELVLLILNHFSCSFEDRPSKRRSDRRILATCTTLSRSFGAIATSLLYRCVEPSTFSRCKRLLKTLHKYPDRGKFVHTLILPDGWAVCVAPISRRRRAAVTANLSAVAELLIMCPQLHSFQLSTTRKATFDTLITYFPVDAWFADTTPFSHLRSLSLSHSPSYDFSLHSPVPYHLPFHRLEHLSLNRFVVWIDDAVPINWPQMPCLRSLTLDDCFLHGHAISHLLAGVKNTIRVIRFHQSVFSMAVLTQGLGGVSDVLEELYISEHWGFDDPDVTFDQFSALKVLRIEPSTWGPHLYSRLPPDLQRLSIWASDDWEHGRISWRVLEDVLYFLQSDITMSLPHLRTLEIKVNAESFAAWDDHLQALCRSHGVELKLTLIEGRQDQIARRKKGWRQKTWRVIRSVGNSVKSLVRP